MFKRIRKAITREMPEHSTADSAKYARSYGSVCAIATTFRARLGDVNRGKVDSEASHDLVRDTAVSLRTAIDIYKQKVPEKVRIKIEEGSPPYNISELEENLDRYFS